MVTLKELQEENEKLRKMQSTLKEVEKNNDDRRKLLFQNKMLARRIKFSKSIAIGNKAKKIATDVGKQTGRVLSIAGKTAFSGIQRYANFLDEQERKQRTTNRKLKTVVKKVKKVKTSKKRKRRK